MLEDLSVTLMSQRRTYSVAALLGAVKWLTFAQQNLFRDLFIFPPVKTV